MQFRIKRDMRAMFFNPSSSLQISFCSGDIDGSKRMQLNSVIDENELGTKIKQQRPYDC